MIVADDLLADTKRLVRILIDDLRKEAGCDHEISEVVRAEHASATEAGRTALNRPNWAEGLYAQVAVAWVLGCVFVRFCEDNRLTSDPLLAGTGNRLAIAKDHRAAHMRANPAHDDRHWLREVFGRYRRLPATNEIFGDHNPVWLMAPSADGARAVLQAFQALDPDSGAVQHDFTDPSWDTRFLGDLYQDLSEHAKKAYALLQTPEFVEEFILDRTLEPALSTFGLRDTTVIDPTCGSGHFLLGSFNRLFERWQAAEPGSNPRELARRAVDAIAGVDINPFAVAIARFRLLLAAVRAGGDRKLSDAGTFPIHIAVGDSLLHGDPPRQVWGTGSLPGSLTIDEAAGAAAHGYSTEDLEKARALLNRRWHAVVGNPPYITVKDPALNKRYRLRFETCHRQYSLGVPFTERFFQLAIVDRDPERCGYVGMITTNSFMKREFGKKLIEEWVPRHDLTHMIDTSGAYIPGHGTPTVILFGRNRPPVQPVVRAVMGIRGEPARPTNPERGLVWSAIVEVVDSPGAANEFVSVSDLDRDRLAKHPWSIGGGGAAELKECLDRTAKMLIRGLADHIGYTGQTNADEVMTFASSAVAHRNALEGKLCAVLVIGESVRDWHVGFLELAFLPYQGLQLVDLEDYPNWFRFLWPYREAMFARATFKKNTYKVEGRVWYEWHLIRLERLSSPLSICFSNVATHNHFVLDREARLLNPHAPAIKLPPGADEQQHLELLGVLNSSTACFWMKQVFHSKGAGGGKRVDAGFSARGNEEWENHFEHDGTKLQQFPLPPELDAATATELDRLATEFAAVTPTAIASHFVPTAERLRSAEVQYRQLRAQMIAAQERLDWESYRLYGLIEDDLTTGAVPEPSLELGERAFEIVLARKVAAGDEETSWFQRHGSTPLTQMPKHWSTDYRDLVQRRIELIETDHDIGLIERPEHKRRWASRSWDEQVATAREGWLLDRLEDASYWPEPAQLTTAARLAAAARKDADFVQVAQLFRGPDVDIAALVAGLVKAESVPFLACLRFTSSGMRKFEQWQQTWELQRREDAGESVGQIPVPPKYAKGDFQGVAWKHRGKLDVPKERFISYPYAQTGTDPSTVIGWAGWNHLSRARALAVWYMKAKQDGRQREHLIPMLAGLAELAPWLKQWYDQPSSDPAYDRPAGQITQTLESEMRALHMTYDDLASWRPAKLVRGRTR